jgi:hypothetical protein
VLCEHQRRRRLCNFEAATGVQLDRTQTEELDMTRTALVLVTLAIVALVAACAGDAGDDTEFIDPPAGTDDDLGEDPAAGEATAEIVGTLGGDARARGRLRLGRRRRRHPLRGPVPPGLLR